MTAALALILLASPLKIAVMPLTAGEAVPEKTADALTEATVAELRQRPGVQVVTPGEIQAVLSVERQRSMLGCAGDTSCIAEIASALGTDRLALGSLSRLGSSWLIHLKLVDPSKATAAAQSDRRLKDKSIDDVLDALPSMVSELLGSSAYAAPPPSAPPPVPTPFIPKLRSGGLDEPFDLGVMRDRLSVLSDGKGRFIAVVPFSRLDRPLFAGDGKTFYAQRMIGASSSGEKSFNLVFWDARFRDGYQRSFGFRNGQYTLQCGEKQLAYRPLAAARAKKVVSSARFLAHRWRRTARALARDDAGVYYFVDAPLDPKVGSMRLFIGLRGKLAEVDVTEAISDSAGLLVLTSSGRLRFAEAEDKPLAEWITERGTTQLNPLAMEGDNVSNVYGDLGVYQDDPLRTPCDDHI